MNPNTIDSIIKQLIASHTTISTMESCTSGLIASLITDTEGASAIFPGGYVTYLNETKVLVGVDPSVIEIHGVYSPECAEAMARTVQENLHTAIAIGITGTTGNLDPNNADSVQGVVYFCILYKTQALHLPDQRLRHDPPRNQTALRRAGLRRIGNDLNFFLIKRMQFRLRSPESRPSTSTHASANAPRAAYGQSYSAAVPRTVRSPRNLKGSANEYH